ncbi:hypothetical protein GF357_01745 [Candidatus Dojkabacteria bacterium]|nr:hypothetical protein [Candidatus Dojkabacteria bacterium]
MAVNQQTALNYDTDRRQAASPSERPDWFVEDVIGPLSLEGPFLHDAFQKVYGDTHLPYVSPDYLQSAINSLPYLRNKIFGSRTEDNKDEWSASHMASMLYKGLNYAVLFDIAKVAERNAAHVENSISPDRNDPVEVLELGTGAAWALVQNYQEIRGVLSNGQSLHITSVDMSSWAISAAYYQLESLEIPFEVIRYRQDGTSEVIVECQTDNPPSITLVWNDFSRALRNFPEGFFEFAYSNHGIEYVSAESMPILLTDVNTTLVNEGRFSIDTLRSGSSETTRYLVDLDKLDLIAQIICRPNYDARIRKNGGDLRLVHNGSERIVKAMYGEAAVRFVDFLRKLLYHDLASFRRYIKALSASAAAQRCLVEDSHSPAEVISRIVKEFDGMGFAQSQIEADQPGYLSSITLFKE